MKERKYPTKLFITGFLIGVILYIFYEQLSQRVLKFKKSFHGLDAFSIPEKTVIRNG